MFKTIAIIGTAVLLSSCAALEMGADLAGVGGQYDLAVSKTRQGIGLGIRNYCLAQGLDAVTRKAQLAEINAAAAPARMFALDCNGDGQPDF